MELHVGFVGTKNRLAGTVVQVAEQSVACVLLNISAIRE